MHSKSHIPSPFAFSFAGLKMALVASIVLLAPALASGAAIPLPSNFLGLTALELGPGGPDDAAIDIVNARWHHGQRAAALKPGIAGAALSAGSSVSLQNPPVTRGQSVLPAPRSVSGFAGISHFDQRTAGTGAYTNTQFSLSPPDQGMCAGNGFVMEAVNNALRVFDRAGHPLTAAVPLSAFYHLNPEVIRAATLTYGQFLSDPRCYYDAATQRWFVSELEIDVDPATGGLLGKSSMLLAVSTSANPAGSYYLYSFDTTSGDGTAPGHPACPCFGDQPLLGADANGVYISTNEFSIAQSSFNGAQLYAIPKDALISGRKAQVWSFNIGADVPVPASDQPIGAIWYSVAPSVTVGAVPASGRNTEYFLSALQFGQTPFDNRIAVWALTGTDTLGEHEPELQLLHTVVTTQTYGGANAFVAQQKAGPTPLRDALNEGDPVQSISANDDRMNPFVVYQGGDLWGAVNTQVTAGGQTRQGIAWFRIGAGGGNEQLNASVHGQGYVAVPGEDVLFGSVAVNTSGRAVVGFTLAGPDYYPSAAYASIGDETGPVRVAGAGVGPADDFDGYLAYDGGVLGNPVRWGDYSAAFADEQGDFWLANEYVGQSCTLDQFIADTTCGGTRTLLANWGTWITHIPSGQ